MKWQKIVDYAIDVVGLSIAAILLHHSTTVPLWVNFIVCFVLGTKIVDLIHEIVKR